MDEHIIAKTKNFIQEHGVSSLMVNDLTSDDLPRVGWSGGPLHIKAIEQTLDRAKKGETEYLAVRSPDGWPIAIGSIDYTSDSNAGKLWQLATYKELQSLGLGSRLITELENRIKRRGLKWATLSVEEHNTRARQLYEKLGYKAYSHGHESWDELDPEGKTFTYHASVMRMKKRLE